MVTEPATENNLHLQQNPLSKKHREELAASGIDPDVISERGYQTVDSGAELLDFEDYQHRPGFRAPMYSPDGTTTSAQLKPDNPRLDKKGKPAKYETPAGSKVILDVHPRMQEEARHGRGDLWITEGIKKIDYLTSRGLCTVGVIGVWNWQRAGEMLPCWDHIALEGRRVYIVFDSDVTVKPEVQLALERIVEALEKRGAAVLVVYLPGPEKGVDDAGKSEDELKALARKFEPSDIAKIRMSKDEKLQAVVRDLWQSWYEENWMDFAGRAERGNWMRGHGCRDTLEALTRIGTRSGKVRNGCLEVSAGLRRISEECAKSHESTRRNILHLEAAGWLEIIPPEDESKPRTYRLKVPRTATRARVDTMVVETGGKKISTEVRPRCQPLRAPSAPRLRWSSPARKKRREFELVPGRPVVRSTGAPARDDQEESPYIKRLGPHRGAVCDVLEAAGGELHLEDLCEALHRKRPRDVRRRTLPMLEEVGVIEVDGDAVRLVRDWLDKLEEERERAGEIEQAKRQAEKHRKRGIEYRAHLERQKRGTPQASYDYARRTKETRERRMREIAAEDARGLEPTPPEVRAFVEKMLNQHDRIRLGLLCEVAQDRGLRWRDVPVAVRRMGYRIERLPEYGDEEFIYTEVAA